MPSSIPGNFVRNASGAWVPVGFGSTDSSVPATLTNPTSMVAGLYAGVTSYGYLRATGEPGGLFAESFDGALDTAIRWTTGGTVAPAQSTGRVQMNPATTISASSSLASKPTFAPNGLNFNVVGWIATFENASASAGGLFTLNNHRFMGLATVPATWVAAYTASSSTGPLLNAIGFEIDVDGKLYPVVYSNGVRTRPALSFGGTDLNTGNGTASIGGLRTLANGTTHQLAIIVRADAVFWYLDGLDYPVASFRYSSTGFTTPDVQTLPLRFASINATSAPATAPVLSVGAVGMGDTGHNGSVLSDPTNPFRRASVGASGGLSIKGAAPAGTSGAIAAAGTGTIGPLDVSEAGVVTFTAKNTTAASAWAGAPVLVFEQSDDNVSWGPLVAVRSDTNLAASTHVLGVNAANTSIMFDAPVEGVNWVRCRVTTGPTTNGMTVVVTPGGMPFVNTTVALLPARTAVNLYTQAQTVGASSADFLVTLSQQKGTAASTSATSFVIPNGKTFRISQITVGIVGNLATAQTSWVGFRLRVNTAGAITTSSTQIWGYRVSVPATIGQNAAVAIPIPDGFEIVGNGTLQYGVTAIPTYAANPPTIDVSITGYEY